MLPQNKSALYETFHLRAFICIYVLSGAFSKVFSGVFSDFYRFSIYDFDSFQAVFHLSIDNF